MFLDSIDNSARFKGVRHRENVKEGAMRRVLIKAGHIVSMDASSKSSHRGRVRNYHLFALDLNGNAVVIGGARNDHQVATWDLVLTPHHLADRSDGIHNGRTRRVGHETLQWF
jgi:hypothetical protein